MYWFLAAILILLAALALDSGLLAYSMYVLLGLLVLTRLLARSWTANLTADRTVRRAGEKEELPEHPDGLALEIGDRVSVRIVVHNNGGLPVPWVLVEDHLPGRALDARSPRLKLKGKRAAIGMVRGGGEM